MSEQDDAEAFAADEAARIAALRKTAPDVIWLQIDPEGTSCSPQWSLLDGATWCDDKINDTDVEYIKGDRLTVLEAQLATQSERADYAWRNASVVEKARQEEMTKRDALQAEVAMLRHHLTELAKFADRAALVLVTIEAEDSSEGAMLQEIIDGTQRWAPDAIRGQIAPASGSGL